MAIVNGVGTKIYTCVGLCLDWVLVNSLDNSGCERLHSYVRSLLTQFTASDLPMFIIHQSSTCIINYLNSISSKLRTHLHWKLLFMSNYVWVCTRLPISCSIRSVLTTGMRDGDFAIFQLVIFYSHLCPLHVTILYCQTCLCL